MELILGANSYLGQHLALARREANCILHSRLPMAGLCAKTGLPFIQADLLQAHDPLATLDPHTVYILARPITQSAATLLSFTQNLQALLTLWATRGLLRRIVFASTQLIYATPPNDTPIPTASLLGPEKPYDCHKAAMEYFLSLLAHHETPLKVEIFRLPLLAGMLPTEPRQQYLFLWRQAYLAGHRWNFPDHPDARKWGNSWAHVDDVVAAMTTPLQTERRFSVRQPVSGHAPYSALDEHFRATLSLPPTVGELHLPKTTFFLQDDTNTTPRPLAEAYPPEAAQ